MKKNDEINILKDKYNKYKLKTQKNQKKIDSLNDYINRNKDKLDNYDKLKVILTKKEEDLKEIELELEDKENKLNQMNKSIEINKLDQYTNIDNLSDCVINLESKLQD